MMVSKKLDIVMTNIIKLSEKVDKLNNIVEKIVFKILTDKELTQENKIKLFKEYGIISPVVHVNNMELDSSNQFYKNLDPFMYKEYTDYLGN